MSKFTGRVKILSNFLINYNKTQIRTLCGIGRGCRGELPHNLPLKCATDFPQSQNWLYYKKFDGPAKESDFKEEMETLEPLEKGEFYAWALYWSVDPYMRAFAHNFKVGEVMPGCQIARVIESKNGKYKIGTFVHGHYGWRTLTKINPKKNPSTIIEDPSPECIPLSLYLGYLGMTGNAAYFGMTQIAKPKKKHTVVVSAAAGAVGSHAGQLAKLQGATVIGITSDDKKCSWCKELGFDHCINYKTEDIREKLQEYACNGVDIYWDNVGGCISSQVLNEMNDFGQVIVCGAISTYNYDFNWPPQSPTVQGFIYFKQLSIQGFLVNCFIDEWEEGIFQNKKLIKCGKLKYREWITEGFSNIPKTFIALMEGENTGKAIVKNVENKLQVEDCGTVNKKLARQSLGLDKS